MADIKESQTLAAGLASDVSSMPKVDRIVCHPSFRDGLTRIEKWEKDRRHCGHSIEHLLDVARILWIFNLERNLGYGKELLYAAALLHDIGRWQQYGDGTPHSIASSRLAVSILVDCGFAEAETELLVDAIGTHSDESALAMGGLNALLYEADKKSRMCLFCPAEGNCNWPDAQKNMTLKY